MKLINKTMNIIDFDFNNKEQVEKIKNFTKILPISEGVNTQYLNCLNVEVSLNPDCYIVSPKDRFLSIYGLYLDEKELDPNIPIITYSQLLLSKLTDKAIFERCKDENKHVASNPFRHIIEQIDGIDSILLIDTIGGCLYYKDDKGDIKSLNLAFWSIEEAFFSMHLVIGSSAYGPGLKLTEEMKEKLDSYGLFERDIAKTFYTDNFIKKYNKLPLPLIPCDKRKTDILGFTRNFSIFQSKIIHYTLDPGIFNYEINK